VYPAILIIDARRENKLPLSSVRVRLLQKASVGVPAFLQRTFVSGFGDVARRRFSEANSVSTDVSIGNVDVHRKIYAQNRSTKKLTRKRWFNEDVSSYTDPYTRMHLRLTHFEVKYMYCIWTKPYILYVYIFNM
jgi:hypothetical protein